MSDDLKMAVGPPHWNPRLSDEANRRYDEWIQANTDLLAAGRARDRAAAEENRAYAAMVEIGREEGWHL